MLKTILATATVALAGISAPAFAHNDHHDGRYYGGARYYYPPARPVVVVPPRYYYAPPPRVIYRPVPVYPRPVAPAFSIRFDFPL